MAGLAVDKDLLEEVGKLDAVGQRRVLDFARLLVRSKVAGVPGAALLSFAGAIAPADLGEMARAIAEGCERIDSREW